MTVPCYHCPDRQAGCHAQCAAYRAFRAELDERNAAARRGKKGLLPLSYGKYVQLFGR